MHDGTILLMTKRVFAALLLVTGCTLPTATTVAVYPDAHPYLDRIEAGAASLNAALGAQVYTVVPVEFGELIDGAIDVRMASGEWRGAGVQGYCLSTPGQGVNIAFRADFTAHLAAHELLHAAGLEEHSDDPGNLLYFAPRSTWTLTADQIDHVLSL